VASSVAAARKLAELLASPLEPVIRTEQTVEAGRAPSVGHDPPYRPAAAAATAVEHAPSAPAVAEPLPPSPRVTAVSPEHVSLAGRSNETASGSEAGTRPVAEAQALDDAQASPVAPEPPPSGDEGEPGPDAVLPSVERTVSSDASVIVSSDAATSSDLPPPPAPAPATSVEPAADDGDPPLDPAAARLVKRVRRLMLVSSLTTVIAVAAVFGVIGYRVFKAADRPPPAPQPTPEPAPTAPPAPLEATLTLPQGARIIYTTVAEGLLVVSLDIGGAIEIRTYDLETLKPAARMSFTSVP